MSQTTQTVMRPSWETVPQQVPTWNWKEEKHRIKNRHTKVEWEEYDEDVSYTEPRMEWDRQMVPRQTMVPDFTTVQVPQQTMEPVQIQVPRQIPQQTTVMVPQTTTEMVEIQVPRQIVQDVQMQVQYETFQQMSEPYTVQGQPYTVQGQSQVVGQTLPTTSYGVGMPTTSYGGY